MWSTSVARMSHAGWCHRWYPPTTSPLVVGGVATGSRPWHLYFAFARTCFRVLFQFVGKRWRRLDVLHGMCAGYLVGRGWWGGRRMVGVLVLVPGFWLGSRSGVGVSGGWRCLVGGSRSLVGGRGGVWGSTPLRPLLNSRPTRLVCRGSRFGPPLCRAGAPVTWWVSAGGSSFLRGWAGLVGGLSCWLCSGRVVLNLGSWLLFSLVVQVRPRVCWGCSLLAGSAGRVSVGGGCSWACCVVPVGWADLDGRALRRPPLSPPMVHDGGSLPPESGGRTHTLKR